MHISYIVQGHDILSNMLLLTFAVEMLLLLFFKYFFFPSVRYTTGHIWACPPSEGDDYIFHCHPMDQKIPKPKRLQEWYKKMLDKAVSERIVHDYKVSTFIWLNINESLCIVNLLEIHYVEELVTICFSVKACCVVPIYDEFSMGPIFHFYHLPTATQVLPPSTMFLFHTGRLQAGN